MSFEESSGQGILMFLVCLIFFPALMVGFWAVDFWAVGFCSFFLLLGFKSGEATVQK